MSWSNLFLMLVREAACEKALRYLIIWFCTQVPSNPQLLDPSIALVTMGSALPPDAVLVMVIASSLGSERRSTGF